MFYCEKLNVVHPTTCILQNTGWAALTEIKISPLSLNHHQGENSGSWKSTEVSAAMEPLLQLSWQPEESNLEVIILSEHFPSINWKGKTGIGFPCLHPADEKNTWKEKVLRVRSCSSETVKSIYMNMFFNICKSWK